MKRAVAYLDPYIEKDKEPGSSNGKILMATVKGDVHDIGKNIVGVVLQCNNYEVIDLGVMVPAETILRTAVEQQVDIIGLSGLITPSLDEMVHVAKEMTRQGFDIPILIGGATTSKAHTAVKIEPQYDKGVVYVNNASRAVGVVSNLLSNTQKPDFLQKTSAEYIKVRDQQARKRPRSKPITLGAARANAAPIDFTNYTPPVPKKLGITEFKQVSVNTLRDYIDWTPFFYDLDVSGQIPAYFRR
jgi:5-methyltetrahydrofolate--homocysteine methyltransferase